MLRDGGLLCVNVVARSQTALQEFLARLQAVSDRYSGSRLLFAKASEDTVNVLAVVIKGSSSSSAEAGLGQGSREEKMKLVSHWFKVLENSLHWTIWRDFIVYNHVLLTGSRGWDWGRSPGAGNSSR